MWAISVKIGEGYTVLSEDFMLNEPFITYDIIIELTSHRAQCRATR